MGTEKLFFRLQSIKQANIDLVGALASIRQCALGNQSTVGGHSVHKRVNLEGKGSPRCSQRPQNHRPKFKGNRAAHEQLRSHLQVSLLRTPSILPAEPPPLVESCHHKQSKSHPALSNGWHTEQHRRNAHASAWHRRDDRQARSDSPSRRLQKDGPQF